MSSYTWTSSVFCFLTTQLALQLKENHHTHVHWVGSSFPIKLTQPVRVSASPTLLLSCSFFFLLSLYCTLTDMFILFNPYVRAGLKLETASWILGDRQLQAGSTLLAEYVTRQHNRFGAQMLYATLSFYNVHCAGPSTANSFKTKYWFSLYNVQSTFLHLNFFYSDCAPFAVPRRRKIFLKMLSSEVKGGVVVPLLVGYAGLAGEAEIPQEALLYRKS